MEALNALNHPNIIKLIKYFPASKIIKKDKVTDVRCVVVEEHAGGGELYFYVYNSGAFTEA